MSQTIQQLFEFAVTPYGEVYLPTINRQQFLSKPSEKLFPEKLPSLLDDNYLNIVIGTDSGLLANYILENNEVQDSRFIFVELAPVLQVLTIDIPQDKQSSFKICSLDQLANELAAPGNDIYMLKNRLRVFESLGAAKAYLEPYQMLKSETNAVAEKAVFQISLNLTQKHFVKKQLVNICENLHPASQLKGKFNGKDCIVVGGGPSLDQHIEWLKSNQDYLYVIAVSRAAPQLHKAGVHVDFVFSVDPQEVSFTVCKEMLELPDTTIFINADHAVPALVGQWPGAQLYTGCRIPWEEEDNIPTAGSTVSNTAIVTAGTIGFNRIFLLGVDLCWSPKGVTHASGSVEATLGPDISKIGVWVTTNSGEMAETTVALAEAINLLSRQSANLPDSDIINLSTSAAQIENVSYQAIESVELQKEENKEAVLAPIRQAFCGKISKPELIQLKNKLGALKKKLKRITDKAENALKLVEHLPETQGKLDQLEDELTQQQSTLMNFLKFYGYDEFSKFLSTRHSDKWLQEDIKQMHTEYYQAMQKTATTLSHTIEVSLEQIATRLEELKSSPDLKVLQHAWLKYNQPSRLALITEANQEWLAAPTEAQQALIDELKQQQHKNQTDKLKVRGTQTEITRWGLEKVPQKIAILYKSQNIIGLSQLIYALDNFQVSDEAKTLSARAKSFLFELEGNFQQAYDVLHTLPEDKRTEIETKQLVLMALKTANLDVAVNGLKELAPLSDEYLPQLAQVLKIKKDYAGALETWLEYLNKHPGESSNWCKLGEMLLQLEQYQDALTVYQQALEADPENKLAEQYVTELSRALAH